MGDTVCTQPLACGGAKEEKQHKNPFPFAGSHCSHFLKDRIRHVSVTPAPTM